MVVEEYRVIVGDRAAAQLGAIYQYIAQFSEQNAAGMLGRLFDAIDGLSTFPRRFKVVGRSQRHGSDIHAQVVDPYIIYYYVEDRVVVITEVIHGARRQPKRFE